MPRRACPRMVQRIALLLSLAVTACARASDYTPPIPVVKEQMLGRLCYVCDASRIRDEARCEQEVEDACDVLRSDVRGPPRIIFVDDDPP